jgi:prepilin-type N-terminal cleavage/methylation domain-containing protein
MIKIQGFTLIEMLIAIAISGIIASLAVPSYSEYIDRANNADAMSDIAIISNTIERFYISNNRHPKVVMILSAAEMDGLSVWLKIISTSFRNIQNDRQ